MYSIDRPRCNKHRSVVDCIADLSQRHAWQNFSKSTVVHAKMGHNFNRNYASILYRYQVIVSYLSKVANFAFCWNFAVIFSVRKLESLGDCVALFA